jgi:hypothetical protein
VTHKTKVTIAGTIMLAACAIGSGCARLVKGGELEPVRTSIERDFVEYP